MSSPFAFEFFMSIREFSTFDVIGDYTGDVLMISGDQDAIVALGVVEHANEIYQNSEMITLKGEGHGFSPEGGKVAREDSLEFFLNHIQ